MSDDKLAQAAAERLFAEHRRKAQQANLPPDAAPADLAGAYAVQDRLIALYEAAGERVAGWKVALTTPVMQKMVGVGHPCEGAIFASRVHRTPAAVSGQSFRHLGVESEVAVVLGRDLAGPGPWSRESVAEAIEAAMPAIELVDDRDCVYGQLDGINLIADNSFNFGCVLGAPVADWRRVDLAQMAGRMTIDGAVVGQGHGRDVLGHPLEAVAWLAGSLHRRGRALRKGDVVMTGSIVATKWLKPGNRMATVLEGLGEAVLEVS